MDSGPDGWRGSPGADPPPCLASPHPHTSMPPMPVSRLIAAKPPPPSASQTPETRFVRYQNRYLGWTACHELLKHIPHALAHLIAAKPSQEQPNAGRQQGFAAIRCAGFGLCAGSGRQVGWKPQWLRSYRVFCRECKHANWPEIPPVLPIATNQKLRCIFDSVQTASRRAGNTARRGVCTLSDVRFFGLCVGPPRSSVIAGLIAAKPGLKGLRRLGAKGFRSYQM